MFRPFRLRLDSRCQADIAQIRSGLDAGLTLRYVDVARSRASAGTAALLRMAPSLRENRADNHDGRLPGMFDVGDLYHGSSLWRSGKRDLSDSSAQGSRFRLRRCVSEMRSRSEEPTSGLQSLLRILY